MSDDYTIEQSDDISIIRFNRDLEIKRLFAVMDEVAAIGDTEKRLWDLSDHFAFTPAQLDDVAAHGRVKWPGPASVAYVAKNDISFGLLRLLAERRRAPDYKMQVFREIDDALVWLEAQ